MLTPNDLLEPNGIIDPEVIFPGKTPDQVNAILSAYLEQAYAQLQQAGVDPSVWDTAATAYVYARCFQSLYMKISAIPESSTLNDQGSITYNRTQYVTYRSWFDQWWATWLSYFNVAQPAVIADSYTVPNIPVW